MKDYKKILEGVVNIINTAEKSDIGFANICTYIGENCPELKESEDESMVKFIKNQLFNIKKTITENYELDAKLTNAICWLEKQGEHAKFINGIQVGDKVTRSEYGVLVNLSQLNRVANKQVEQKPAAWSKEDEKQARQIERIVHDGCTQKLQKQIADWFESLKERYTWKPSEEQIESLKQAKTDACGKPYFNALASLYINLKGY